MRKLIQKLALVAMALLTATGVAAQTTFVDGDFLYTVLDAGENTVSIKSNVSDYTGALTIPATVVNEGVTYKVTKVAESAFNNHQNITSITFEGSNLEEIGRLAFKNTWGVTGTVTIPASVKIIDVDGFCRCYADNFVFASGSQLETLGEAAFWEGKFTTMPNLPNTLTSIGNECFKRCSELTDAWLPASVTKIPYATFAECPKLTSATVAGTVTELGEAAFWSCPLLASVTFEESSTPLKLVGRAFQYCYALTSINLPDRINQMGESMFYYCKILESAHFPTSMTVVPAKTFDCCYALSSVTGIDQVTRIELSAFGDCAFTSFTIPAGVEFIGDYAFANQNNCASYTFAGNNVTQIGSYAFQNNKTMTSFTLPASVTSLGNEVFLGCTELTSFDLPSGVTIGTGLFSGCSKLASVNLPNDITEIPNNMFYGCSALTGKFTIPATVTRIGRDAFRACNNITEVEFPANSQLQTIDFEAFYMDPAKAQLGRFIMPNTVTTLGNGALRGCKKLDWDNFHLSTQVTMLPGHVFCDCGFTQFPLEETNVTTLDFNVFDGNCFTEFHMPASVTMSSSANFYANHKLERFYFEDGCDLTEIKSNTFAYCENLNYIYLPVATPPTLGYSAMPEAKQVFIDVPAEAIAAYKANSAWANFKYALTLENAGTTDLALDDASQRYWSIYEYNGLRYLYNDQNTYNTNLPNNLMSWTFNNTVEKEYSLLLNACNMYYTDANDYLEISLVKYNADGTTTTVQTKTVKIDKCTNNYYAYADKYEQVLVNFDNALEVSKYAVTFKRLGSNGKFVWNAQMVPTADICIISPVAKPAAAGEIAVTGDLIQVKNDFKEITLNAATIAGADWISFANWTIDGAEVGTDATYTFTPSATTEVVANYNITPQNIPADLDNFVQTQAVLNPANPTNNSNSIYWYPNTGGIDNYVYIRDGNSATYFVQSTKPALYNLKFKTSSRNSSTSAYIVDVINADGDVIFTKQNDIAQTPSGWYDDDMNEENVAITTPLLPNEVYSVRFTFISKDGDTGEIANLNFVQFEVAAIVPDVITVNKDESTVKVSAEETLTATLATTTNDAVDEDYLGVEWTSSDAAVATVDATGKVTAVAPGTATITAKATGRTDIDLTADCVVTVPQHVTDITVVDAHEMYVGNVDALTAVAAPENAADKTLTWTSSDDAVVDVDADGKLTAKKAGTATITVTAADRNVVCKTVAVTVHQPVTGITLNETSKDMLIGQALALTATLAPADPAPYNKNLDWTSTDTDVATVAVVDGVVTVNAVGKGTANIIATAADGQGATAQCAVTVTIPVATITMPAAEHLFTGATLTLTPTIAPANADNKAITWTSSAPEVATVDDGTVTALTAGTAVITATAADGSGVTAQTTVTVTVAVTDITINAGSAKTMHKGDTFTMTATTNADATDKTVTWTSDNEAVAEVSAAGVVTAKIGGIANITATANDGSGVSATCAVTVDVPVTSVTLDQTSATVYKDVTVQLKATVNPDDATVKTVTWTSSAPAVASVSATGLVTALSAGDATITVKSDADASKFATFAIHVMSASAAGTGANQLLFHEEVNNASFGDNCIAWNNASDKDWVANNIIITDANDYTSPYDVEAATLTYKRTFTNDSWQPLYVPFNMAYTEWCDKVDIAKISGVHEYDDGTTLIEFRTVKSGEILPNVPYIIRAKSTSDEPQEFICTNKTLSATPASDGYVWCASTERRYTLTGSYKTTTGLEGALGLSSGTFYTITSAETVLKAMRFYLTITDENHGYGSGAPAMGAPEKVHIMVDGQTTDLLILGNEINNDAPAYNVQGIRVNDNYKGVIIQNGRKVLNK